MQSTIDLEVGPTFSLVSFDRIGLEEYTFEGTKFTAHYTPYVFTSQRALDIIKLNSPSKEIASLKAYTTKTMESLKHRQIQGYFASPVETTPIASNRPSEFPQKVVNITQSALKQLDDNLSDIDLSEPDSEDDMDDIAETRVAYFTQGGARKFLQAMDNFICNTYQQAAKRLPGSLLLSRITPRCADWPLLSALATQGIQNKMLTFINIKDTLRLEKHLFVKNRKEKVKRRKEIKRMQALANPQANPSLHSSNYEEFGWEEAPEEEDEEIVYNYYDQDPQYLQDPYNYEGTQEGYYAQRESQGQYYPLPPTYRAVGYSSRPTR